MVSGIEKLGNMLALSASPYEYYNLRIEQAYGCKLKIVTTKTEQSFSLLDFMLKRRRTDAVTSADDASERSSLCGAC